MYPITVIFITVSLYWWILEISKCLLLGYELNNLVHLYIGPMTWGSNNGNSKLFYVNNMAVLSVGRGPHPCWLCMGVDFLQYPKKMNFLRFPWENQWFSICVKLNPWVSKPFPFLLSRKKSHFAVSRVKIRASVQSFHCMLGHILMQHQTSLPCVSHCSPSVHCVWGPLRCRPRGYERNMVECK